MAWHQKQSIKKPVIVVTRTALEDRTLQEELPGYHDYAQRALLVGSLDLLIKE